MTARTPCDVCCRVHRGPRCRTRTHERVLVTLPPYLADQLRERVQWGERSQFIARLLDDAFAASVRSLTAHRPRRRRRRATWR